MAASIYKPGDTVPYSGVYRVEHDQHRQTHDVTVPKNIKFPFCLKCKDKVRFSLVRIVRGPVQKFEDQELSPTLPSCHEGNGC